MTHQSRSTAEDEGGDRRQVGKLLHDVELLPSNAFHLRLEGWLPRIQLQNLVAIKEGDKGAEKKGWGNRGTAFIPYVLKVKKTQAGMQYNRRHCRLLFQLVPELNNPLN